MISSAMLAGFLYMGAGVGMGCVLLIQKTKNQAYLFEGDMPYTIAMVVLDVGAPILLMYGIQQTNAAKVSLLNNSEIVATSLIALLVFKERISGKLLAAIILVVISGIILGFEDTEGFARNR